MLCNFRQNLTHGLDNWTSEYNDRWANKWVLTLKAHQTYKLSCCWIVLILLLHVRVLWSLHEVKWNKQLSCFIYLWLFKTCSMSNTGQTEQLFSVLPYQKRISTEKSLHSCFCLSASLTSLPISYVCFTTGFIIMN